MSHLNDTDQNYFSHLFRAWKIAFVLLVHGVLPDVWKTKASDLLCKERLGDDSTRAYMLKHMYGIVEKKYEETPSIWDRMSDRELAIRVELGNLERAEEAKEKPIAITKKKTGRRKK